MVKNVMDRKKAMGTGGMPVGGVPVGEVQVGRMPVGGVPVGEVPVGIMSVGGASAGGALVDEMLIGVSEMSNAGGGMGFDVEAERQILSDMGINEDPKNLGFGYITLRALGVDPQAAFKIADTDRKRIEMSLLNPPPAIGRVNNKTVEPKSFYSPEEVDKLTPKDLEDTRVLEDVMRSMTKWQKN